MTQWLKRNKQVQWPGFFLFQKLISKVDEMKIFGPGLAQCPLCWHLARWVPGAHKSDCLLRYPCSSQIIMAIMMRKAHKSDCYLICIRRYLCLHCNKDRAIIKSKKAFLEVIYVLWYWNFDILCIDIEQKRPNPIRAAKGKNTKLVLLNHAKLHHQRWWLLPNVMKKLQCVHCTTASAVTHWNL